MRRNPCQHLRWLKDSDGVALYVLLPFLIFGSTLLALGGAELQSFRTAHATMTRYVQIALQQMVDEAQTVTPATGAQWTPQMTPSQTVSATFIQDLAQELQGTPWASMPVHVQVFQVLTPQDVGQPAPAGYPGSTVTAPGYYALVTYPWHFPFPGPGTKVIPVAVAIQANTYSARNGTWNPAP